MPAPATTGNLVTSLTGMQIGDYIACNYQAASNTVGTFSNLGRATGEEIPVNGAVAPNGIFYFVKVDKGLLIADRVVQHSISWDKLNAGKFIQGFPLEENIVPVMTSNTSPSGVASASHERVGVGGDFYEAWRAFNRKSGTNADRWVCDGSVGWLAYEFTEPKLIQQYSMYFSSSSSMPVNEMPKSWTFEGTNDDVNWDILDARNNITSWTSGEVKKFNLHGTKPYKKYRINITANNGAAYTSIHNLYLESVVILRSLTGGVAYADANGNMSLTDQGYGGWPVNNEWDVYVAGFPADKIQAGKTLDDIFHFSENSTWCQDTTLIGVINNDGNTTPNSSTWRTRRGYSNNSKWFAGIVTSFTSTATGFRPVLEFRE